MRFSLASQDIAERSRNRNGWLAPRRHRPTSSQPRLERLEGRTLLAAISEFAAPTASALPAGIASGIVAVPGGDIWFTEPGVDKIGKISTSGATADYAIPTAASNPEGITYGPDGNLWFTEAAANKIGVINTAGVVIAEYAIPSAASNPQGITTGPDGNLWFTEAATGKIGRIVPSTGAIIEYPIKSSGGQPEGITAGPDGNLWFTEPGVNQIGQISPATGTVTEYPIKTASGRPQGITTGPDGNLWFTEGGAAKVGVITTSGTVTEYPVPTAGGVTEGIAAGSDGNLWFTEPGTAEVGRITPSGIVTEFATPTTSSQPWGITNGPDGNLWFTEAVANKIGQVTLTQLIAGTGSSIMTQAGTPFTATIASFTPAQLNAQTGDFTATIDWGDGSGTTSGTITAGTQGTFNVAATKTYSTPGTYQALITVHDQGGAMVTVDSTITVAYAATGGTINPVEGQLFIGQVATFSDPQTTGQVGQYAATIAWGDGNSTTGVITYAGGTTFNVTGSHTYAEESTYPLIVTVLGPSGRTFLANGQAIVADAPLHALGTTALATASVPFTGVVATFSDDDPLGTVTDYQATIVWGDGQTSVGTIAASATPGQFTVTGTNTYATPGPYSAQVTIRDVGGASAMATTSITVAYAATGSTITPSEGQPFAGQVASFSDPQTTGQAGQYSATINWGDGTTATTGTVTYISGTDFTVAGSHTYAEEGPYTITVTIAGPNGRMFLATGQAVVPDATLSAVPTILMETAGVAFTGTVATFSDADPAGTASDYQATIIWGDGHTSAGTILPPSTPGGFFSVSGSNTYATAGTFMAQVTIRDVGGASAIANSTVTVANATGNTINPVEGQLFIGQVATFSDPQTTGQVGQYAATIAWGDGNSTTGVITYAGGTTFNVTGSHTYAEESTYPLIVTVLGPGSRTFLANGQAIVADAPLHAVASSFLPIAGVSFTGVVATFSDDDPMGTVSDYQATILWGDGHTSAGTIATSATPGQFTVTGTNTYATTGSFPLQVTIRDMGGASAMVNTSIAVASSGNTINAVEGQLFNGQVATFTDPTAGLAGQYAATINWGDGVTSSGLIASSGSMTFAVSGSHIYAEEGNYAVTVNATGPNSRTFLSSGQAVVADAPLSASTAVIQPTTGVAFTGVVATFTDADPMGTVSDYQATIVWGDGHTSTGIIAAPASSGFFTVTGTNTYATAGTYQLQVTITDSGGSTVTTAPGTVAVGYLPVAISGHLDPASISGPNKSLKITNVNRPTFEGITSAFAMVQLFAQRANSNPTVVMSLGQTISGPDGAWSLTSPTLPDGVYTVSASVTGPDGFPTPPVLVVTPANPLVIDTVGPRVAGLAFDAKTGMITVVIDSAWTGLDSNSLTNPANYILVLKRGLSGSHSRSVARSPAISGFYTGAQSATLQFNGPLVPGRYLFEVASGGVIDEAGNALDGEFTGRLPSGNGQPGGNFIVQLIVPKHSVSKPHGPRPSRFRLSHGR